MQQQTRARPDYYSALTLAHELLGIDPDSPTLVEYAGGLLLASMLDDGSERVSQTIVPQKLGALLDRGAALDRMRELCAEYPGTVVAVEFDGGRFIGQGLPLRPDYGARAKPIHAAPR